MSKHATLYRMETEDHICPYGLKSKYLLESHGFEVEDHPLHSRAETDTFKEEHHVDTTPQTFIEGHRVGGHDALREYLNLETSDKDETSYTPVIAIFSSTALMSFALQWQTLGFGSVLSTFIALSMCVLAILKLRDLESFSNSFLGYDLLAQQWVPYAYLYPFAELTAGVGMLAGILPVWVGALSFLIGTAGAVSVFKAVYIDKRELTCACVGGNSNVPLGFVSLTENLMMLGMGLAMILMALI